MAKRRGKKSEPVEEKPACGMCQVELTWRDYAYAGATAKRCKRCHAIVARDALRGHYVSHAPRFNRAQRRSMEQERARLLHHRERWLTPKAA